jgi:Flp pilus assembly protein TadG
MRPRPTLHRFKRDRRGVAALEFALVIPILITALLATTDIALATITWRNVTATAQEVAEIASAMAVQPNSSNQLTDAQALASTDAVFGIFPAWKSMVNTNAFTVTMSDVAFTATVYGCQTGCTYTAQVAWSYANPYGSNTKRACGALTQVANNAAPSYTTLPAGAFGATSALVVDVNYTYQPLFFGFVIKNIPMLATAYVPPRIGNGIFFVAKAGATNEVVCAANATQ